MAIHFHNDYGTKYNSRNFGDDINPFLLGKLFEASIIKSSKICLVGIGTILNERHAKAISHFNKKIVFSSGTGYGFMEHGHNDSWDFTCVRGPKTATALKLPPEKGICDGAILLSEFYPPKTKKSRNGIVFIPHVNTGWAAGLGLQKICSNLELTYLSPDANFEVFIDTIRSASLVVTEAMHGAILADTMRTPWVPINFLHHNRFKWEDWHASISLPYKSYKVGPLFWDRQGENFKTFIKAPYTQLKVAFTKKALQIVLKNAVPFLSDDDVIESRKNALKQQVIYINDTYAA